MGKKLIVLMKHTDDPTDPGLRGFPYHPDQYIDFESCEETEDRIEIDLGEAEDTTAAQELFLNQHPRVIRYWVE
ncbi:MAG: hypothetical protein N3A60_00130 [Thermanaerothrix sp.]|nr:hypothetical protein [Thermanaerothrix sp.]